MLVINGIEVSQNKNGLFCLNDIHRASGGLQKNRPTKWFRLGEVKDTVENLTAGTHGGHIAPLYATSVSVERVGQTSQTYAIKELVYLYAMWIDSAFAIELIRAVDALINAKSVESLVMAQKQAIEATYNQQANSLKLLIYEQQSALERYANHEPDDVQTLSRIMGCTRKEVRVYYEALVKKGILEKEVRDIQKTTYHPLDRSVVVGKKGKTLLFDKSVKKILLGD